MKLSEYINSFTKDDKYRLTNWNDRLKKARPYLFNFDYPVYNNPDYVMTPEEIKENFEMGFMRRYYKRELGNSGGTITDFQHDLEEMLLRKMPYYNSLFHSLSFDYDLLDNTNVTETFTRVVDDTLDENTEGNEKIDSTRNSKNDSTLDVNTNTDGTENSTFSKEDNYRGIELDTPQGSQNIDDMSFKHASGGSITKDIETDKEDKTTTNKGEQKQVGNNVLEDINSGTSNTTNKKNQTKQKKETYTQERKGKIGVNNYARMIADYRNSIINVIEEMVLDCDVLFYQLYEY